MTDEQLQKLIEGLKPPEKSRWEMLLDNTMGTLIGALTIGFFALLWQLSNDTDKRVAALESRMGATENSILGLQETFKKEIGDLAGPLALQASIKESVLNHAKFIEELDYRLDALERRITNAVATTKPPVLHTNAAPVILMPFPTIKTDELIKAVREKEDGIDKRFRDFEQRSVPKK